MACIGLDIGTTHACVGVFHKGKVHIIANNQGFRTTPCCIAYQKDDLLIGETALRQPDAIYHFRQALGLMTNEAQAHAKAHKWSFPITSDSANPNEPTVTLTNGLNVSPIQFCARLIQALMDLARDFTGETIKHAVLTVPSHFSSHQRTCLTEAANSVGLNVMKILSDSSAAAIAMNLDLKPDPKTKDESSSESQLVCVYDVGGSSHDVTLLSVDQGLLTVLGTHTTSDIPAGDGFTCCLLNYCLDQFKSKNPNVTLESKALRRLKIACEAAKRSLSQQSRVTIEVDSLAGGMDFMLKVSQSRFEDMIVDAIRTGVANMTRVVEDAGYDASDLSSILLIGGSVRIPLVTKTLQQAFPSTLLSSHGCPEETITMGASMEAQALKEISDWTNSDETFNQEVLIPMVPLSLGFAAANGAMEHLIHRDSVLPVCVRTTIQLTSLDQDHVTVQVYEGERAIALDNTLLGHVTLRGLAREEKQNDKDLEINVTFDLDVYGTLTITCCEPTTNKKSELSILSDPSRLTKDQVLQLIQEAEEAEEQDMERLNQLEASAWESHVQDTMAESKIANPQIDGHDNELD